MKLWCLPWVEGHISEDDPDFRLRGCLSTLIAIAGDCEGDKGIITWTPEVGLSIEQVSAKMKSTPEVVKPLLEELQKRGYLEMGSQGQIIITQWDHWQSEYERQKSYRAKLQSKVTAKVTRRREKGEGRSRRENGEEKPKASGPPALEVMGYWNEKAKGNLPLIDHIEGTRLTRLRARWEVVAFRERWQVAIDALCKSRWHTGRDPDNLRGWKADFDWFVANDTNWTKALTRGTR